MEIISLDRDNDKETPEVDCHLDQMNLQTLIFYDFYLFSKRRDT